MSRNKLRSKVGVPRIKFLSQFIPIEHCWNKFTNYFILTINHQWGLYLSCHIPSYLPIFYLIHFFQNFVFVKDSLFLFIPLISFLIIIHVQVDRYYSRHDVNFLIWYRTISWNYIFTSRLPSFVLPLIFNGGFTEARDIRRITIID